MKARQWMRYLCLTVVLVLSSGVAMTQPADKSQVIADLQKKFPNLKITINPRTGMPNSVTGFTPEMYPESLTASAVSEPTDEQLRAAAENYFTTSELSEAHAATGNR